MRSAWGGRIARLSMVCVSAAVVASACGGDDTGGAAPTTSAEGCVLDSDCAKPLTCAFGRCHSQCAASSDCPAGERCLSGNNDIGICLLPDENGCKSGATCPGTTVCASDEQCRSACAHDADCLPGQTCTEGVCADPAELDGGHLSDGDAGGDSGAGGGAGADAGNAGSGGTAGGDASAGGGGAAGSDAGDADAASTDANSTDAAQIQGGARNGAVAAHHPASKSKATRSRRGSRRGGGPIRWVSRGERWGAERYTEEQDNGSSTGLLPEVFAVRRRDRAGAVSEGPLEGGAHHAPHLDGGVARRAPVRWAGAATEGSGAAGSGGSAGGGGDPFSPPVNY